MSLRDRPRRWESDRRFIMPSSTEATTTPCDRQTNILCKQKRDGVCTVVQNIPERKNTVLLIEKDKKRVRSATVSIIL